MILSGLDLSLSIVILSFSLIGLIRGFLNEITSIINWFGAFYLTSIAKPFLVVLLQKKITVPFLPDIIANIILFVIFTIILSISTNYILLSVKKILPASVNGIFGFIFGAFKGGLLSILFLSGVSIIYKNTSQREQNWLKKSIIYDFYNNMGSKNIFSKSIENILGDMLKETNIDSTKKIIEKNIKNETKKLNEIDKKDMDKLLDLIVD